MKSSVLETIKRLQVIWMATQLWDWLFFPESLKYWSADPDLPTPQTSSLWQHTWKRENTQVFISLLPHFQMWGLIVQAPSRLSGCTRSRWRMSTLWRKRKNPSLKQNSFENNHQKILDLNVLYNLLRLIDTHPLCLGVVLHWWLD